MADCKLSLAHSLIATKKQKEDGLYILLTVYCAGDTATGLLQLTGNLTDCLTQLQYSRDAGESWQQWQGGCDIGSITSGGEETLLLRGIRREHGGAQEPVLAVVSRQDGSVCGRVALTLPDRSAQRLVQCRYLSCNPDGSRHCCLL